MRRVCMKWDIYFDKGIFYSTQTNYSSNQKLVGTYLKNLNLPSLAKSEYGIVPDKTYDDTLAEEFANIVKPTDSIDAVKNNEDELIPPQTIKLFGFGFTPPEYTQLQNQFDDWVKEYECKDKAQRELLKNMCIVQLQIQRAVQKDGKIEQLMSSFNTLLGSAKLKPSDSTNDSNDPNAMLGVWLSQIERYTPAEYFSNKKKYSDFDKLGDYATRFIFRPLKNLFTGSKDLDSEYSLSAHEDGDE